MLDKYFEPFIYFLRSFIYKQHVHFTLHTPFHWLMFNWVNTDDLHSYFTVYTTKQWHSTPHVLTGKRNYSVMSWCWFHNSMEFMFREMSQTKVMLSSYIQLLYSWTTLFLQDRTDEGLSTTDFVQCMKMDHSENDTALSYIRCKAHTHHSESVSFAEVQYIRSIQQIPCMNAKHYVFM